jgi:hypothetical protein
MLIKSNVIIDDNGELADLFEEVNSKYHVGVPISFKIVDVMAYLASTSKYLKYKKFSGSEPPINFGELYSKLLERIELGNEMQTPEKRSVICRSFPEIGL